MKKDPVDDLKTYKVNHRRGMTFTITKYDIEKNVFEINCVENKELDRFDPFVSGIHNGDEFREFNLSLVGKEIEVDGYGYGRTVLLHVGEGENKYRNNFSKP